MSAVLVDSNILLDLFSRDPVWYQWSATIMRDLADRQRLIINPIIYAEVSVRFTRVEDLEAAMPASTIHREPLPYGAAFLAGKCFADYRRRGGDKRSPLPDFFIGAHAAVAGYELVTRDRGRFTTYFPKLTIHSPAPN